MSRRITTDKYTDAIAYLLERPEEISEAWEDGPDKPYGHPARCLFADTGPNVHEHACLTQVRAGRGCAATPWITVCILADDQLPTRPEDITPEHLPHMADMQRALDWMGVR